MREEEKKFREAIKQSPILHTIIGEFRNEYGELFVLYTMGKNKTPIFVTGDELDWQEGYMYLGSGMLGELFNLSDDEDQKIKEIINEAYDGRKARD